MGVQVFCGLFGLFCVILLFTGFLHIKLGVEFKYSLIPLFLRESPRAPLQQDRVRENQSGHRFHHRDGAGDYAGVMAAADTEVNNFAGCAVKGFLRF